jgi:uncharacterized protein
MTVSLKDMMKRLPLERQRKIRARAAVLIAQERARSEAPPLGTTFQIYVDASGGWRWHLVAANGRILAASGEVYKTKKTCLASISRVKSAANAETAIIEAA